MKDINPLYQDWDTPYGSPPFELFKPGMYIPAIEKAIEDARKDIEKITSCTEPPTFENTIEELEKAGRKASEIAAVLFNLNLAETSPQLQEAAREASRLLTRFSNDITLNTDLFERVNAVSAGTGNSKPGGERGQLLKKKMRIFILGGAALPGKLRERFREINEQLSKLSLMFEENILAETNSFFLHITDEGDLAGLPSNLIAMAADEASSRSKDGWIFTLHHPSYIPFMQYSDNRELRRQMFTGYALRCCTGNSHDNRENVKQIVNLRLELAKMLGYRRYSDMVLEDMMAGSTTRVNEFLEQIHGTAYGAAQRDLEEVIEFAGGKGHSGDFERWDWAYWAEKLKMEKYSLDDELLRPYFRLEAVEKALFGLAGKLYGISFLPAEGTPVYHHDVKCFDVKDEDGSHLGLLMLDYHPRKGKSSGAWMTAFREQYILDGKDVRPVISMVMNFSKPTGDTPSLLTHNELTTLLHEFGHAMHGMMSKCTYESLSGTNVPRDFVELPSQVMENWAYEKEWLDTWAVHYITGDKIPAEIMEKIKNLHTYNEGYACNRQLGFGFLDMAWHTLEEEFEGDIVSFEREVNARTELFRPFEGTSMSSSFGHLFSGGYAAGYYGYKWAEVLDADAFSLFRERGITDRVTALSFRKNILEKGSTEEALQLYIKFRGKEPSIDALLERSGFKKE